MRIISNFKDFYDGLNDGSDSHIWTRHTSVVEISKTDPLFKSDWKNPSAISYDSWRKREGNRYVTRAEINFSLLVFCGQLIPFWQSGNRIGYDLESLIAYRAEMIGDQSSKWYTCWKESGRRLFDHELPAVYKSLNMKYKSPVLILSRSGNTGKVEITLNPRLMSIEFHKYHDMYWTFQELERYLFNDMVEPCDPSITISDKLKAEAHGFRDKYSFRNEPKQK